MERMHDELQAHVPVEPSATSDGDVTDWSDDDVTESDMTPTTEDGEDAAAVTDDATDDDTQPDLLSVLAAGPPSDSKLDNAESSADKGSDDIVSAIESIPCSWWHDGTVLHSAGID
eukprot:m.1086336 g.1086336  ORF g.1086336 m.1086336 type:complete len:116 (+) comp24279_c0_seq89:2228-2575(+)